MEMIDEVRVFERRLRLRLVLLPAIHSVSYHPFEYQGQSCEFQADGESQC